MNCASVDTFIFGFLLSTLSKRWWCLCQHVILHGHILPPCEHVIESYTTRERERERESARERRKIESKRERESEIESEREREREKEKERERVCV